MGYITIEVELNDIEDTWNFFYGEYIEEKWAARLADSRLHVFQRFEADSIEGCFSLLASYLSRNVEVLEIKGNSMEKSYIKMLSNKLDFTLG
jgi:hypothetical protein